MYKTYRNSIKEVDLETVHSWYLGKILSTPYEIDFSVFVDYIKGLGWKIK